MHNVAPSRALTRRSRQLLQLAFVVVSGGIFLAAVGLVLYVVPLAVPGNPIFSLYNFVRVTLLLAGGVAAVVGLVIAANALLIRPDNDLARITGEHLAHQQALDARCWFVRHVSQRGLGYIDAVLVGPPGALVFRIMGSTGAFINEGADWLKEQRGGKWAPAGINPTRECQVDMRALHEYLAQRGLGQVPVFGVVVFTQPEMTVRLIPREPHVPIAQLRQLYPTMAADYLAVRERIDQPTVQRVVDLLYDRNA
ncbi:MAG: hypothetical protein BroJett033_4750 [Chloroflexota bacterium]|nr:MAG: hypothetical protein BroJett033_4750 [Chloroflexota bacterium]